MPQTKGSKSSEQPKNKKFFPGGFWWITLGAAILCGVVLRLSRAFDTQTAQYTFIAQGVLNILIFAAILVQALIYRRQWDSMAEVVTATQIGERAYIGITAFRIVRIEPNQVPSIYIKFLNGGRTPAWKFTVRTTVSFSDVHPAAYPEKPQSVETSFVPAGRERETDATLIEPLSQKDFDDLQNGTIKLFIRGKVFFEDCWGDDREFPFDVVYRPRDGRFEDYRQAKHEGEAN
jgi:hypothetical protein